MNFFDHQERAKRRTFTLTIEFLLAVVLIILAVHLAIGGILTGAAEAQRNGRGSGHLWILDWRLFACTAGATILIILLGSLSKMIALRGGGQAIAQMLGGTRIDSGTADHHERQLLNIVEEMSIASGIRTPPVYVLRKEHGINAFAAGSTVDDAVIAVSEGSLRQLSRDEIQGVVAHEYSHILNGDMRLNLRLMGMIHGILVLGLLGRTILGSLRHMRFRSSSGREGKGGGGAAAVILIIIATGAALWIIGSIGVIFGRLIKAAISRQREFLADASAVQWTRNPDGIAGALMKIGGLDKGAHIESRSAEQASHLFFGDAVGLSSVFATHPPLEERIRRVKPQWDGTYPRIHTEREPVVRETPRAAAPRSPLPGPLGQILLPKTLASSPMAIIPAVILAQAGNPSPAHLEHARELLGSLPEPLREAAHEPLSAQVLVFALLLDPSETIRATQTALLTERAGERVRDEALRLQPLAESLEPQQRLPLLDMAMPTLQQMSKSQLERFLEIMDALIQADERVSLGELVVQTLMDRNLRAHIVGPTRQSTKWYSINGVVDQCEVLLSTLAHRGNRESEALMQAFQAGVRHLGKLLRAPRLRPAAECTSEAVLAALRDLPRLGLMQRRQVLEACIACSAVDNQIQPIEAELLRAISASLDIPMPPLLPGGSLG
ncbi:M48 family metallopeptidase [Candidatus Sumerlaeota bacterium]|nr:M48 family metallopeptidase [Candidatus Sumerlaeota bacterium]